MDDILTYIVYLSLMLLGFYTGYSKEAQEAFRVQSKAVTQCEENLPRNQRCEVVITAKVVPTKELTSSY